MHNDECCTGQKWRVHAHTHEHASCAWFDHSHTRPKACRAPFGCGGRLGKQNAVRAILGILVSSSRENMRILEDAVRQTYSLEVFKRCACSQPPFLRGTTPGFPRRGLASTSNVLFAQRLQTGPVPSRQSGSVLDLVIANADVFTLREVTRQSGASISAAFDGCG